MLTKIHVGRSPTSNPMRLHASKGYFLFYLVVFSAPQVLADDWPSFRGYHRHGNRSAPSADAKAVYCLRVGGDLIALSSGEGKEKWRKSSTKDFGNALPDWGFAESPFPSRAPIGCVCRGGETDSDYLRQRNGLRCYGSGWQYATRRQTRRDGLI